MLVENKILKKVKELGLNSYEAKIWTALLSRGVSTAGEISDIANVPRSRSYDVLESLEKKGFIVMKVGKPIQYIAVPPEEVLERVKKNVMNEAEQKVSTLKEFEDSTLLQELVDLHNEGIEAVDPTDIAGYLKGRHSINEHLKTLIKNANHSIVISTSHKGAKEIGSNLSKHLNKVSSKGVSIHISTPTKIEELDSEIKMANIPLDGGFVVVDGKQVVLPITSEDTHSSYHTAIWVDSESLGNMLSSFFTKSAGMVKVDTRLKTSVSKKLSE